MGFSAILNKMFTDHGDTLDYGYMVLDYGGKDSVWLRLLSNQFTDILEIATQLKVKSKTLDHFMGKLLHLIAMDKLDNFNLDKFVKDLPDHVVVSDVEVPTLDSLED